MARMVCFFSPNTITAQPGAIVQFQFVSGNHTVTQSTFANPCVPINSVNNAVAGFFSGFMDTTTTAQTGNTPVFELEVNDTTPIWIYCSQGAHCQKGMVMVINENASSGKTLQAFQSAAASAPTGSAVPTSIPTVSGNGTTSGLPNFGTQTVIPSTMGLLAFVAGVLLL